MQTVRAVMVTSCWNIIFPQLIGLVLDLKSSSNDSTLACIVSAGVNRPAGTSSAWRCEDLRAIDVQHVIKHYAAKGRLEPNHKIDSAGGNFRIISRIKINVLVKYQTLRGESMPGGVKLDVCHKKAPEKVLFYTLFTSWHYCCSSSR